MTEFDPNTNNYVQPTPVQGDGFTMSQPTFTEPAVNAVPPVEDPIPNPAYVPPVENTYIPPVNNAVPPVNNTVPPVTGSPNANPYSAGYRAPNGNANPYSNTQYPNSNPTPLTYQETFNQQAAQQANPYAQQGYQQNPYQQPVGYTQGYPQEDPTKNISTWSMCLGIGSLVIAFLGWFAVLGLGCGIAAIVLAVKAGKQSPYGKRNGMATAGLICGIIGTCLGGIVFACTACAALTVGAAGCAGMSNYYH